MSYELSNIFVYPVKSLGGFSVPWTLLTDRGLQHDRRWMLVDDAGRFLSQREFPEMAMLAATVEGNMLLVKDTRDPDLSIHVDMKPVGGLTGPVSIWQDICQAEFYPDTISDWFREVLSISCRLVRMPDQTTRLVDPDFAREKQTVSFADGFPNLIVGESSMADLNSRLDKSVSVKNFRPNLVFSGGMPFAEDRWNEIQLGEVRFQVVKPCSRCSMVTIDPETGEKGTEPLTTLSRYRRDQSGVVVFGQNLLHTGSGRIETGMRIKVVR